MLELELASLVLPLGQEVAEVLGFVEHKAISLWLHLFLKRMAKKFPDIFITFMSEYCDDKRALHLMELRYIKGLKFKQIPEYIHVEERQIYKIHQKVIDNIINK